MHQLNNQNTYYLSKTFTKITFEHGFHHFTSGHKNSFMAITSTIVQSKYDIFTKQNSVTKKQ